MNLSCDSILEAHLQFLRNNSTCRMVDGRVWIVSPYSHADGDMVEIAIRDQGDGTVAVSDLGETLRHLSNIGYDPRETTNARYLLNQILKQHRMELDPSGIIFTIAALGEVGEASHAALAASLAVGNLAFLARATRSATIQEEVAEHLRANELPFKEHVRVTGKTGKVYVIDFEVGRPNSGALVKTISASTMGGVTGATNAAVRAWLDIAPVRSKATVVDDRVWPWRSEDLAILNTVGGHVYKWSEDAVQFTQTVSATARA